MVPWLAGFVQRDLHTGLSCACAPIRLGHIGSDVPITNLVSDPNYFLHSKLYTCKERNPKLLDLTVNQNIFRASKD